ncbi:MAG TPA: NBR1-Ig-like domain-containing protein [Anaerolineales bacterium]|nr:NBR1-Ig-like domain-containing protein [Anaerolineales bacterium]
MKRKSLPMILFIMAGLLLTSCTTNSGTQAPAVDTDAIRTQAVATYASSLTEAVDSTPVNSPTPIVEIPTTTPLVTVTLEPSPTSNPCYNLMYLKDVTIPDGTPLKPGEVFTKTWQVQNIGGCAWRSGFTFQNVGGDAMRGSPVVLTEAIQTGAKREISVELVVPSGINGVIESAWRMADDTGNFFGDTLTVQIVVGDITTPAVTSTP